MDRKTPGDGPLRLGVPSGNDREQTSSNHAGIKQVGEIVEMQHLTLFSHITPAIVSGEQRFCDGGRVIGLNYRSG